MTRLLVSVRSVDEALLAADEGVDLIDVKEPSRGPLGMADSSVRREIGLRLGARHRLSAACGELLDFDRARPGTYDPADWAGYRFAKIGLAGCAAYSAWRDHWLVWRAMLPAATEPVLVCYADGQRFNAPCYDEVRAFASDAGIGMLLFDTWDKNGPGLCELWQTADFLRVGQELKQDGIGFVLAGKLGLENVPALTTCEASYLGIRGAVCNPAKPEEDVRCGKLNPAKIIAWQQALRIGIHKTTHEPISIDV